MPYKVIRADAVKKDTGNALDYYDSISIELGMRFEEELQTAFKKLGLTPQHYYNLKHGYRRVQFESFPYMLVYKIDELAFTVKVMGLFHQHSNPASIYRKISRR